MTLKPPVQSDPVGLLTSPMKLAIYNGFYQPSSANNNARLIIQTPDAPGRATGCFGTTQLVMRKVSENTDNPNANLYSASSSMMAAFYRDRAAHNYIVGEVTRAQMEQHRGRLDIDLPNHERWTNTYGDPRAPFGQRTDVTQSVIDNLRENFSIYGRTDPTTGAPAAPQIDMVSLASRTEISNGPTHSEGGHIISIQRSIARGDYLQDQYVLYDNNLGAFRYEGFNQLAYALSHSETGSLSSGATWMPYWARINYYSPTRENSGPPPLTLNSLEGRNPEGPGSSGYSTTHDWNNWDLQIEPPTTTRQPTIAPDPTLPPPNPGAMLGSHLPGDLKKRDAGDPAQPDTLYRPSILSPDEIRKQGGFSLGNTTLGHVNLGTHAGDLDADSKIFDSAGYLGTFRNSSAAMGRLPGEQGKATGYVYDIAPSPNMVNVDASLGGQRNSGEFAAMGHLDWTQVRGWQQVNDGTPGAWQRNPDYRWDVYDQTSTAGAQPQLAHYRADDPALGDPVFKPYVSSTTQDGKTHTALAQAPDEAARQFYVHANDRLQLMDSQVANRQNYRGAMQVAPDVAPSPEGNSGGIYAYDPSATSWAYSGPAIRNSNAEYQFNYGPDGRFHSTTEPNRVLRLNSNGQLFLGNLPDNANSTNGVFEYTADHRLRHVEDGKYLSRGSYDAPVGLSSSANEEASKWNVTDDHRRLLDPFSAQKPPSYSGSMLIDPTDGHEANHLYVQKPAQPASMQTYVGDSGNDSNNTNVRRFIYGSDGRFHDANNAERTLGVDTSGNLVLGARPADPASLNGVFRYDNGRLIHAEDNKYLTRGGAQSALSVSADDKGDYSKWTMKDDNGARVTPPSVTLNDFNMYPPAAAHKFYRFNQDPDSALPAGTNRFVTQVPGIDTKEVWDGNENDMADPGKASEWLNRTHSAWLFQDGYYAVPAGSDALEIRRLDGATVGRLQRDATTKKVTWKAGPAAPHSTYKVPATIWDWLERDEASVGKAANGSQAS